MERDMGQNIRHVRSKDGNNTISTYCPLLNSKQGAKGHGQERKKRLPSTRQPSEPRPSVELVAQHGLWPAELWFYLVPPETMPSEEEQNAVLDGDLLFADEFGSSVNKFVPVDWQKLD
ncbi:hypothetical protein EJB05_21853, partial [Eragrostis curvula]